MTTQFEKLESKVDEMPGKIADQLKPIVAVEIKSLELRLKEDFTKRMSTHSERIIEVKEATKSAHHRLDKISSDVIPAYKNKADMVRIFIPSSVLIAALTYVITHFFG